MAAGVLAQNLSWPGWEGADGVNVLSQEADSFDTINHQQLVADFPRKSVRVHGDQIPVDGAEAPAEVIRRLTAGQPW